MRYENIVSIELLYQIQKYININRLTLQEYCQKKGVSEQLIEKVNQKKELTYREIEIICDSIKVPLDTLRTGPMETIEFKMLVHEATILEKRHKSILLPLYERRFKRRINKIIPPKSLNRYLQWLEYQIAKENSTDKEESTYLVNSNNRKNRLAFQVNPRLAFINPSPTKSIKAALQKIEESKKKK